MERKKGFPGGIGKVFLRTAIVFVLVFAGGTPCFPGEVATRVITDMAGRQVRIPVDVGKVLATSPPPISFVYMLAPEKLMGWMMPGPASGDGAYVPEAYRHLPIIPRGLSSTTFEAYIAMQPDLVIFECEQDFERARIDQVQQQMGTTPIVAFSVNETRDMSGYIETIRFIADLLDVKEQGENLIAYYNDIRNEVDTTLAGIPVEKRRRVYYAENRNGLTTDPIGSQHSQLIEVGGGVNAADCPVSFGMHRTPVTMESVLMWQPEVIIATDRDFITMARKDPTWQKIPAVHDNRMYLIPTRPFNWFDRPPGINRIVGIPWVAHILYPDKFSERWTEEKVRDFYARFYHYQLNNEELARLLDAYNKGPEEASVTWPNPGQMQFRKK